MTLEALRDQIIQGQELRLGDMSPFDTVEPWSSCRSLSMPVASIVQPNPADLATVFALGTWPLVESLQDGGLINDLNELRNHCPQLLLSVFDQRAQILTMVSTLVAVSDWTRPQPYGNDLKVPLRS